MSEVRGVKPGHRTQNQCDRQDVLALKAIL
jgi:hypothetical protein